MAELRWNPLLKDWVMIASHRQGRPQMPKDWCPFCPGSGRVPDTYDVHKYDNDFPALSPEPPEPDSSGNGYYKVEKAFGKCEVILYSPEHNIHLSELSVPHVRKLVDLWTERYSELKNDPRIRYVFIFENRGEMVGVTMPHPHGQIYGYPFLPKRMEQELEAAIEHRSAQGECIYCRMLQEEQTGDRLIFENDSFVAFLPFFVEYPYGIYLMSKEHRSSLEELSETEKTDLADALISATTTLDGLFDKPFPYLMCVYQNPVNGTDHRQDSHLHIKFFPPLRSEDKQKFNASSETGAGAHCNPCSPEEKAAELRNSYMKNVSERRKTYGLQTSD